MMVPAPGRLSTRRPSAVVLDDAVDDGHANAGTAIEKRLERMEEIGALLFGHVPRPVSITCRRYPVTLEMANHTQPARRRA